VLEPAIVAQAVPRIDTATLDRLGELARRMKRLGRPGRHQDLDTMVELNHEFHGLFVAAADNAAFAASLRTVTHAAVVRQNYRDYDAASLARSLEHHLELVAATSAQEPEWAASVMRAHLFNARATMVGRP
jgi:DNA-binding GntR family transcriptional regulator